MTNMKSYTESSLSKMSNNVRYLSIEQLVSFLLSILSKQSDEQIIKLSKILEKLARNPIKRRTVRAVRAAFENRHPSIALLRRLLRELHPNCKKGIVTYIVNAILADSGSRDLYKKTYGVLPPIATLISPTMRCNLRCAGCYAGNYGRGSDMDPALFSRLISESTEMGVHLLTILGGEPFVYRPLLDIIGRHRDAVFQVFTNGTLINRGIAREIISLGNLAPVISIEGWWQETDSRRGAGTFGKVMEAMDILRQEGALFLFSVTATRDNYRSVVSEEFIDLMIAKGAALGWYFNYMPVGREPSLDSMPTPEQRNYIRSRINEIRSKKPILLVDFWGDGALVDGCLAGGKLYLHITNSGDVEPCIFAHYAVDNVKDKSLAQVLNSDFFTAIRRMQPFGHNAIRPCPLIDYPGAMRHLVRKYGAQPTHPGAEKIIDDFLPELRNYARRVAKIYGPVWEKEYRWAHKSEKDADIDAVC